jgi:hypothetical protein
VGFGQKGGKCPPFARVLWADLTYSQP